MNTYFDTKIIRNGSRFMTKEEFEEIQTRIRLATTDKYNTIHGNLICRKDKDDIYIKYS